MGSHEILLVAKPCHRATYIGLEDGQDMLLFAKFEGKDAG